MSDSSDTYPLLQVEDDENDVLFLEHAFKQAGIINPVHVVRDGQEAIDYLCGNGIFSDRKQYPLPCLMLLDLKLPRKNGLEVLGWIRQSPALSWLPVIVFSSSAHRQDIRRAYELGASSFVVKPSCVERRTELAKLIKGYWLEFNQAPFEWEK